MSWVTEFMAMTPEERLQELTTIGDKLRDLRREVIETSHAKERIDTSTRDYGTGWQGQLVTDMDEGENGQTPGVESLAEALEGHFE